MLKYLIPFLVIDVDFHLQSKCHRLYLDGKVKIKSDIVLSLKSANTTFPLTTPDHDTGFIRRLVKAVFTQQELKVCVSMQSLRALDSEKLKFSKGTFRII